MNYPKDIDFGNHLLFVRQAKGHTRMAAGFKESRGDAWLPA
jgi:hypothetical protein